MPRPDCPNCGGRGVVFTEKSEFAPQRQVPCRACADAETPPPPAPVMSIESLARRVVALEGRFDAFDATGELPRRIPVVVPSCSACGGTGSVTLGGVSYRCPAACTGNSP